MAQNGTISPAVKIIPAHATINELKKKAEECEQVARVEVEPVASKLREKVALFREWIAVLKTGNGHHEKEEVRQAQSQKIPEEASPPRGLHPSRCPDCEASYPGLLILPAGVAT
jgi:hypothetical protein